MRKEILLIVIAIIVSLNSFSQKTNLGFSIHVINDIDWNKPMKDFQYTSPYITLRSQHPIKFGINFEEQFKIISPSLSLNLIYRNIKYSQYYTSSTNINHFTLELPVNVNFRKLIGSETSILFNAGGGMNYIITSKEQTNVGATGIFDFDTVFHSFKMINPNKLNAFINAGIGIECSLKKIGTFQCKAEYFYQFSKQLQYQFTDKYFTQLTNKYRLNYGSIGLVYYLPIFNRNFKSK
jgi:hypothetical protein